jgi:hypothetical protein
LLYAKNLYKVRVFQRVHMCGSLVCAQDIEGEGERPQRIDLGK